LCELGRHDRFDLYQSQRQKERDYYGSRFEPHRNAVPNGSADADQHFRPDRQCRRSHAHADRCRYHHRNRDRRTDRNSGTYADRDSDIDGSRHSNRNSERYSNTDRWKNRDPDPVVESDRADTDCNRYSDSNRS